MLKERGVEYDYREYREDPLDEREIRSVLKKLGLSAHDVLRGRDAKKHGIDAEAPEPELIAAMAKEPTLLQRPILVVGDRAALGRPVEGLLELV